MCFKIYKNSIECFLKGSVLVVNNKPKYEIIDITFEGSYGYDIGGMITFKLK